MIADTPSGYTREKLAELFAWDWAVTVSGDRLHHVAEIDEENESAIVSVHGVTSCGIRGVLYVPGLFTRMGARRCSRCSDKLGWPRGVGSPKNDDVVRPLVLAALRAKGHNV